jgi:hypothetical protein
MAIMRVGSIRAIETLEGRGERNGDRIRKGEIEMGVRYTYGREVIRTDGKKETFVRFKNWMKNGEEPSLHIVKGSESTWCGRAFKWFAMGEDGVLDMVRHEMTWPSGVCLQCCECYRKRELLASERRNDGK